MKGVDYAWEPHPDPKGLKGLGYDFVVRYVSLDPTKNLSKAELTDLRNASVSVVLIWETTTNRAMDGYSAGLSDARQAMAQARSLGMPEGRPIYFAVDFEVMDWAPVHAYFSGIVSLMGSRHVGVYGGFDTIMALRGSVDWLWQTYAWSHGRWWSGTHIRQVRNGVQILGADCDIDEAIDGDIGQWGVDVMTDVNDFTKASTGAANRGNSRDDLLSDSGNVRDWLYDVPGGTGCKNPPPVGSRLDIMFKAAQSKVDLAVLADEIIKRLKGTP